MKRLLSICLCCVILLCSCATKQPLPSFFPNDNLVSFMGKSYNKVNSSLDLKSITDHENPYTSEKSNPNGYTCALTQKVTLSDIEFTPIYHFASSNDALKGLVEVKYEYTGTDLTAEKFLEVIEDIYSTLYSSCGMLRPMYGLKNDLADFFRLQHDGRLNEITSGRLPALTAHWTVKKDFSSDPRIDMIAKMSVSASVEGENTNYSIIVSYTLDLIEDWERDWLEQQ